MRNTNRHPLRKVIDVESPSDYLRDVLECGHKIVRSLREKAHKKRRCPYCKDIFACPKCGKRFVEVNGLYVRCSCGYIDDSNYNQITQWKGK